MTTPAPIPQPDQWLRALLRTTSQPIGVFDKGWTLIAANSAFAAALELDEEAAVGAPLATLTDQSTSITNELAKTPKNQEPDPGEGSALVIMVSWRRRGQGDDTSIRTRVTPLLGEADVPIGYEIVLLGSTNATHAQSKLVSRGLDIGAPAPLQTVLDTANSAIVGLDDQRRIVTVNPAARHMLGGISEITPFDWPKTIVFLNRQDLRPLQGSEDPVQRALSGKTLNGEVVLMSRARGGRNRYVRISASPVAAAECHLVRTVLVLDDVSEQEHNRQQIERRSRLDALGQLTGGMAHDFNNLLATTLYSVELLKREPLSDVGRSIVDTAIRTVRRGAQLTKRLLAFARLQPGVARSRVVSDVLKELKDLVRPTIEESLHLMIDDALDDVYVYCDQAQLDNALLNVVLNGRDAIMRSGSGDRIVVKARTIAEIDQEGGGFHPEQDIYRGEGRRQVMAHERARTDGLVQRYVEFSVADNGPGMSLEVKSRATDPFFTTKDANSGTGLGLSMVYGFVQQSNGELRIYSEEGQGTTVRIILPRGTPEDDQERPVAAEHAPRGSGERVLLVEDEDALLRVMSEMVAGLGYDVTPAPSGRAALALLDQGERFDVILTDIVMPGGIGGFELARQARDRMADIPIIYMSGYTGFSDEEMGDVQAPLVAKPSGPAEVAVILRKVLTASPA